MNLIGLPVDDDEAVGTAIQQIDVALDEVIADRGGNPQLSPELTRRRFGGDRRRKCVSGESFDYVLAVGHPLSCGLGGRRCRQAGTVGEPDDLEHAVHGPPDRRAVAALLPRRQIQIARLLVETGIRGLGCLPGEGGGGDDGPGARPLECVAAFGQPGVAIGNRHRFRRTECRA